MPNEFTVQDLFDLVNKDPKKLHLRYEWGKWCLDDITFAPTEHCIAHGTTPDELRKALEGRAVPTADEAAADLAVLRTWARTAHVDKAMTRLGRYIEHTKGKADG